MQTKKFYVDHLITPKNLVVIFDSGPPITIPSSNGRFEFIKSLLETGAYESVAAEIDYATRIREQTKGKFVVQNGAIVIDGEVLPKALSDKLIEFVDRNLPTEPLENFWDNLSQNPAESAKEDLFAYLEANQAPLTPDGCFIAYKKVRDDWYDSHTGKTYVNKPGMVVRMDRNLVDADRRHTCSAGLHVAAWGYASGFSGERILEVKVNPRDVVAVPPDYEQQKMRVCEYLVVRETDKPYDRSIYEAVPLSLPFSED